MEREYTYFEETHFNQECLERVRHTDKSSIEDFEKVFSALGFTRTYGETGNDTLPNTFSVSVEKTIGSVIVNGAETVQTEVFRLNFTYDTEDFGEIDGDICNGMKVSITVGPSDQHKVFEETVYCRPEDMQLWTRMYLDLLTRN